jgi:hypothetical protein
VGDLAMGPPKWCRWCAQTEAGKAIVVVERPMESHPPKWCQQHARAGGWVSSTSPPASTRWMLMASAWTIAEVAVVPIRWDVRLALEGRGGTTRMGGREAGGMWAGGGQEVGRTP